VGDGRAGQSERVACLDFGRRIITERDKSRACIVFNFLGFEPLALAIPSPEWTEKETYFERNVETKSV
jgi:hypothetical protein